MAKPQTTQALEEYDEKKYNRLWPAKVITESISAFHVTTVTPVQISPDPKDGDVYELSSVGGPKGKFTFHKQGLQKISGAAGIQWDPHNTHPIDDRSDSNRVVFQATGGIRMPDGTIRVSTSTYEFDLKVQEELVREFGKNREHPWTETKIQKEIRRRRQFKVALAETGAKRRVLHELLQIKDGYTKAELEKPFAVPRIDFMPNLDDPRVKEIVLARMMASGNQIFGAPGPAALAQAPPVNAEIAEDAVISDAEPEEEKPTVEEIRKVLKDELFTDKERKLFDTTVEKDGMKKLENRKKAFSWASTQKDKRGILRKEAGEAEEGQQGLPWNGE